MIADIAASILLNKPLPRSREWLDSLYDEESKEFQLIENRLATYGSKKLEEDIVKTFSILGETLETYIAFLRKMRYDWALGIGHWALGIGHTSLL